MLSLIGVRRAFEEAGVEPELISGCSGGCIWGSQWAAGLSAEEMAEFSLSWRLEDYLDIQWAKLPGYALSALRGFTGIAKGEAIERTFTERFGALKAGSSRSRSRRSCTTWTAGSSTTSAARRSRSSRLAGWCGSRSRCRCSSSPSRSTGTCTSTAG